MTTKTEQLKPIYRDNYIDFIKGLAVISIIFIHTVFFSGASYVPMYWRNLALLFDVSVFFLMTGCALTFTRASESLILHQIVKLSTVFTLTIILFQTIFWNFNTQNIIDSLFLKSATIPEFPVFGLSYWFVPAYVVSIIFASTIIKFFPRIIIGVLLMCWLYYFLKFMNIINIDTYFLGQQLNTFLFYSCIILLGYRFYKQKINNTLFIIIFTIALGCHLMFQNILPNFYLQQFKFPVSYIYINASMISVSLIFLLKNYITKFIQRHPCPFLEYLGRNCIYFYLSQGISSSLLYKIVPFLKLPFGLKLLCATVLNIIMAITIGFALNKILSFISATFDKLKNRIIKPALPTSYTNKL